MMSSGLFAAAEVLRPARSAEVLTSTGRANGHRMDDFGPGSRLQDGIMLKVSVPSDTSLHRGSPPTVHRRRESSVPDRKHFLALPGEEDQDRSHRRHSVQSPSPGDRKRHDRKSSFPETEILSGQQHHHHHHHRRRRSATPSPSGSYADLGRRRSSSRDVHTPSRRSSNGSSSADRSRRSSRSDAGRRESSVSTGGHRRSRGGSTVSISAKGADNHRRNSSVAHQSGRRGKYSEDEEDPDDPAARRRKVIILIIGSAFIFILLMSVLLVAVTLTLSPKIDELDVSSFLVTLSNWIRISGF